MFSDLKIRESHQKMLPPTDDDLLLFDQRKTFPRKSKEDVIMISNCYVKEYILIIEQLRPFNRFVFL